MDERSLLVLFIDDLLLLALFLMLLLLAETGELGAEFDLDDRDLLLEPSCLIINCEPLLVRLLLIGFVRRDVLELLRLRFS